MATYDRSYIAEAQWVFSFAVCVEALLFPGNQWLMCFIRRINGYSNLVPSGKFSTIWIKGWIACSSWPSVILIYDYFLMLRDEVGCYWKTEFGWVKVAFYLSRYVPLLGTMPIVLGGILSVPESVSYSLTNLWKWLTSSLGVSFSISSYSDVIVFTWLYSCLGIMMFHQIMAIYVQSTSAGMIRHLFVCLLSVQQLTAHQSY